jgi:hypothetical protein
MGSRYGPRMVAGGRLLAAAMSAVMIAMLTVSMSGALAGGPVPRDTTPGCGGGGHGSPPGGGGGHASPPGGGGHASPPGGGGHASPPGCHRGG